MGISAMDHEKIKRLCVAAMEGEPQDVEALLAPGMSVDVKSEHGWTLLMYASSSSNLSVARWLIEKGAGVDERDELGWTAAMIAADSGALGMIDVLQQAGADFGLIDSDGCMASDRARVNHHAVLAAMLDRWMLEKACPAVGKSEMSPRL